MLHYHLFAHPTGPGVICQGFLEHFIQEPVVHEKIEIGAQDLHPIHIAALPRQGLMDLCGYGRRALLEDGGQAESDR